jgi:SHS2 domain-containing protein
LQSLPRLGPAEDAPEQWVTMHEIFDHTADLGLRVQAETYEALCSEAAQGLAEVIAGGSAVIHPAVVETLFVVGDDPTWLLVDLLAELLAAFELRRMLFVDCRVSRTEMGLQADCRGERFDPARHQLAHEVKAITQHELRVVQTEAGWEATLILDI